MNRLLGLVLGSLGLAVALGPEPSRPGPPTREEIEVDLRLELKLRGDLVVFPNSYPAFEVRLVNRSSRTAYPVVRSGDGSREGRREPHVYFTAETVLSDGRSISVAPVRYFVCGLFSWAWERDVVVLKPGEHIVVQSSSWGERPLLAFEATGDVVMRAHYEYRGATRRAKSPGTLAERYGLMTGVPDFRLVSNAVGFRVVRPLDVRVRVKRSLKLGESYRTADVVEVELVGLGSQESLNRLPVSGSGGMLHLEAAPGTNVTFPDHEEPTSLYVKPVIPRSGESIELFGGGWMTYPENGRWVAEIPGTARIRAVYLPHSGASGWGSFRSEWVEVRVER